MNRTLRVASAAILLVSLVMLCGCGRSGVQQKLTVTGSTTVEPIADVAADDFQAANPGKRVLVAGVGSSAGIESVANGTSDIGTSSRELAPSEKDLGLFDTPIALDAIAVIVNPSNPVSRITEAQAAAIFEGKLTNWKQLGGPDMPIGLVNRDESSGTRQAFSTIVLNGADFDPSAAVLPGTGQVRAVVAESAEAVGYISLGFVDKTVKALAINGIVPTEATVANHTYPVSRVLHFFTKGRPTGLTAQFIRFVLSAPIQDHVVRDAGFLPIAKAGR